MKKILPLLFIFVFSMQNCFAKVENSTNPSNTTNVKNTKVPSETSIGITATTIPSVALPLKDSLLKEPKKSKKDINNNSTKESQQFIENNAEPSIQLQGYLEYNNRPKQNIIELEPIETAELHFSAPKTITSGSLISNSKMPSFRPIQDDFAAASKFATQEYSIKPVSSTYVQKVGKMSFGTMYGSSMWASQVSYSTGVFTKFEGKYFALKTAFSKNTNNSYNAYSNKFYFAPELKLTKRLSLLDIMKTDIYQINKGNELVLRYTPHLKRYSNDIQFEVGAGQAFHEDKYIKSSVRFSTIFKL